MLSTDPEKHPIEPRITPLVFEMKRLLYFQPCWSCEGHTDREGNIHKLPAVWFYCKSTIHLRLLNDAIKELEFCGRLIARWQISVTYSDPDNPETTYALMPAAPLADEIELVHLQADIMAIAGGLHEIFRSQAVELKGSAGKQLTTLENP